MSNENMIEEYELPDDIRLFGRSVVYTPEDEITDENVIRVVNSALYVHAKNMREEEYLYWYRRGIQPILHRTKTRNTFILNKVTENHADEIVSFKNGYFLTQPAFYVSRRDGSQEEVDTLNEYLYRSGKADADNAAVDWFHTVGFGYIYVRPTDDPDVPFKAYALDPRSTLVARSLRPGSEPIFAVSLVIAEDKVTADVYTKRSVYRLNCGAYYGNGLYLNAYEKPQPFVTAIDIESVEANTLGLIPIVDYHYNSTYMSAFEGILSLLDQCNNIQSNRADGVEQFIQNLMVIYNAMLPDDTTAEDLKKQGVLFLKSTSELKADVKIISEQLDQSQTQIFVDDLLRRAFAICGMPSQATNSATYDTTGAAVLANFGWYQADAFARNTEDLFKAANRRFDEIILAILKRKNLIGSLSLSDFELNFVRNESANSQSKAQTLQTYLSAGMAPELAFAKSGVSNDPVKDVLMSEKWLKMIWGDPDAPKPSGEATIIEEDRAVNDTGGAV